MECNGGEIHVDRFGDESCKCPDNSAYFGTLDKCVSEGTCAKGIIALDYYIGGDKCVCPKGLTFNGDDCEECDASVECSEG